MLQARPAIDVVERHLRRDGGEAQDAVADGRHRWLPAPVSERQYGATGQLVFLHLRFFPIEKLTEADRLDTLFHSGSSRRVVRRVLFDAPDVVPFRR